MAFITNNKKWLLAILLIVVGVLLSSSWSDAEDEFPDMPKEVDFSYHIQPILSQNCYICHGNDPSTRKAGLRLDQEEGAKTKLESGATAIVEGSLNRSSLITRILSEDPLIQMPPPESKKSLTSREIALLKKWIKQGAKYQDHWAFIKPQMPSLDVGLKEIPKVIDHFVDEKLNYKQLNKGKPASKNEMIRRVAYLITGLPPKPEEIKLFVNDKSEDAYEAMLDRYLASPAYGERWARHWMDLVRYGESMGHEGDFDISHAYEYRDYLIRAFNQDVPYDQFVKEHLAGDMISNPRLNPASGFNESHLGTGYYFLGDGKHSPVDTKLEEADKIDNIIDVTTKTFQSMTVACSRCHDHKFDPIPTADYYSMYGMIESSRLMPKSARKVIAYEKDLEQLGEIKEELKNEIISFVSEDLSNTVKTTNQELTTVNVDNDTSVVVLAEFRDGDWDGWYTDGIAFGEAPVKSTIAIEDDVLFRVQDIYNKKRQYKSDSKFEKDLKNARTPKPNDKRVSVLSGFASSRAYSSGLQGVLHSPNFVIEHDTIAVRARGFNGTIRVIMDNFQVVQNPLWGGCEKVVMSKEWKTYKMDVHLAKGHKAYLQFMPGKYSKHVYGIQQEDYVEVEWAVAYSGDHDISKYNLELPTQFSESIDLKKAISNWKDGKLVANETMLLNKVLSKKGISNLVNERSEKFSNVKMSLFDPTHFVGMSEGESVLSPVFIRGSHTELEEDKQTHRFLSATGVDSEFPTDGSGRMAWANALVSPENPLTSRVIVNRLWHHLFGKGLVETVDNFGLQGKIPSHPELLDYLAIQFVNDSWSIKKMLKKIMLSEAFKRSTNLKERNKSIDPENIYLSSFPIRRLESEAIRDGILAVAGCLDEQMFGEGVPVYLSKFMTGRGRPRVSGPLDSYGRRSIYRTVRRNFIPEMMLAFDMPIPFSTYGSRNTTNVPAQSLILMNNPFIHEQAEYWAQNLLLATADFNIEERINNIYLKAFSRMPSKQEVAQGVEFLSKQAEDQDGSLESLKDDPKLWKEYCHMIFNFKEFIHLI